jgi:hypothetical protein
MVHRPQRRLGQLFNRNLRRRDVGVAETKVDHVAAFATQLALELVDGRKHVRGELVNPPEIHQPQSRYAHAG